MLATLFAAVVVALSVVTYLSLENWTYEVIETNKTLTRITAGQLRESAQPLLDSLAEEGFFQRDTHSREEFSLLDNRMKALSSKVFGRVRGLKGGFYFDCIEEFIGYSYPSSPPPAPVYGPPPRSYNIIKDQLVQTMADNRLIVKLHQFDPAMFPLTTDPLSAGGIVVGAVWTRIHIERELPAIRLRQVINVGGGIALLGFVIAVWFSVLQRRKITRLHADMEVIKSGETREVSDSGGTIGSIGRSVNALVRALEDGHQRREQLERALNQREKMAALGNLVAGVVHEVKTPLAIMKTRVQMWQKELARISQSGFEEHLEDTITDENLQMVVHETNRLSHLVNRLLVFSRPIADKMQETDLTQLLSHTVSFIESSVRNPDIQFDLTIEHTLPHVMADPNSLEQVLLNVLTNAVESITGSGDVRIETRLDEQEEQVAILIRDDGSGIPDHIRQKMFDPFVTTKKKGFGLGLSIAYEIITAHRGTIQYDERKGGGTLCTIELPVAESKRGSV